MPKKPQETPQEAPETSFFAGLYNVCCDVATDLAKRLEGVQDANEARKAMSDSLDVIFSAANDPGRLDLNPILSALYKMFLTGYFSVEQHDEAVAAQAKEKIERALDEIPNKQAADMLKARFNTTIARATSDLHLLKKFRADLERMQKEMFPDRSLDDLLIESFNEKGEIEASSSFTDLIMQSAKLSYLRLIAGNPIINDASPSEAPTRALDVIEKQLFLLGSLPQKVFSGTTGGQEYIENDAGYARANIDQNDKNEKDFSGTLFKLNFDEIEASNNISLSKKLTSFDQDVFNAVCTIAKMQSENNERMSFTITSVYKQMGKKGKISDAARKRICDSINSMLACKITLRRIVKGRTTSVDGNIAAPLLPGSLYTITTTYKTGEKATVSGLEMYRMPALYNECAHWGMITTYPYALLQAPINDTERNISIRNYLISRIQQEKNHKKDTTRITWRTLFQNCGIADTVDRDARRKAEKRAKETVVKLLTYFHNDAEYISAFSTTKDAIAIRF